MHIVTSTVFKPKLLQSPEDVGSVLKYAIVQKRMHCITSHSKYPEFNLVQGPEDVGNFLKYAIALTRVHLQLSKLITPVVHNRCASSRVPLPPSLVCGMRNRADGACTCGFPSSSRRLCTTGASYQLHCKGPTLLALERLASRSKEPCNAKCALVYRDRAV